MATELKKVVTESFDGAAPAKVDRDKGVIHDVLVLGPKSRNGIEYPSTVREAAVEVLNNKRVNLSHSKAVDPTTGKLYAVRAVDYDRRLGKVMNLRNTDTGVRGDLKVLKSHPFTATLFEAAEEMPEAFGLSPVMEVAYSKGDPEICLRVLDCSSVDIVTDGGTVKSLYEEAPAMEEEAAGEELEGEAHHLEDEEVDEIACLHKILNLVDEFLDGKGKLAPQEAGKRFTDHLKDHAKKYHGKEEEEPKEEEAAKEEEYRALKAEKDSRLVMEEHAVPFDKDLLAVLVELPSKEARTKHVLSVKRAALIAQEQRGDPKPPPAAPAGNDWAKRLRSR